MADVARFNTRRKITCCVISARSSSASTCAAPTTRRGATSSNFTRERIFEAGVGHHSPIGGYLEAEDLVFVLDVNADYQPWLIERSRAVRRHDRSTATERGSLLIE